MRNVELSEEALQDLAWWTRQDPRKMVRLIRLFAETAGNPFSGIGKPEPLRGNLAGLWSKRIDDEHRLLYRVDNERLYVIRCRGHY